MDSLKLSPEEIAKKGLVLKRSLAFQMNEFREHKYYLSEKVHYDIGFETAFMDWIDSNHASAFREAYQKNLSGIEMVCGATCGKNCRGAEGCILLNYKIHELLKD